MDQLTKQGFVAMEDELNNDSSSISSEEENVSTRTSIIPGQELKPVVCRKNINGKRGAECMALDDKDSDSGETTGLEFDSEMETPEERERRLKANSQERTRMQRFNFALNNLRRCIPDHFRLGSRRLSKIRTLRLAINYIAALQDILQQEPGAGQTLNEQTTPHFQTPFSEAYHHGDAFNCPDVCYNDSIETPSRLSLRDIAQRGLSAPFNFSSPDVATTTGPFHWSKRHSTGTSGESSDDSFCTDQRFLGDSPESLMASAFSVSNAFGGYQSSHDAQTAMFQTLGTNPHFAAHPFASLYNNVASDHSHANRPLRSLSFLSEFNNDVKQQGCPSVWQNN